MSMFILVENDIAYRLNDINANALWYGLADYMTVYNKDDVRVRFKDGTEIASGNRKPPTSSPLRA